jgi:hypothetical protein
MSKQIVVTGDVAIDHLYLSVPPTAEGTQNWSYYPTYHAFVLPGGAFLLADFTKNALAAMNIQASISSPQPPENLEGEHASDMVHAKMLLGSYRQIEENKEKKETKEVNKIRIKNYLGYSRSPAVNEYKPSLSEQPDYADMLILDDAGNGFRDDESNFPKCLNDKQTLIIYKMSRPLTDGPLWKRIAEGERDCVLVINIKDLRNHPNANISKGLSWERTALETVFTLGRSESLYPLENALYTIILFGTDGALLYPRDTTMRPVLIFDACQLEGGFAATIEGYALSTNSAFTAALAACLVKNEGLSGIKDGIKAGLNAMRNLLSTGFKIDGQQIGYQANEIFSENNHHYSDCYLERPMHLSDPDPSYFRILDKKTENIKLRIAADIVKEKAPDILKEIPVGKFEKLETFDRREIEQFNAIKSLIQEFLNDPKPQNPLCFAVFGPPGSGKSFGVKQVVASLKRNDIETLTFNISQYASYNELITDFHKIRDKVLAGVIPVAFFDEFDSSYGGQQLGWLKYFLSPMQDGVFKEGEVLHPLGKCIFVFAGGTKNCFEEFELPIHAKEAEKIDPSQKMDEHPKADSSFRDAKGSDFISRLRGFVDIMGPNRNNEKDAAYMIRRAKILRGSFERTDKTKQLINAKGKLQIDRAVLRAMLNIPEYRHGNRSMTALIDMSRVADKKEFELSSLPAREQLNMHVNGEIFLWMAAKERFYTLLSPEDRFEIKPDDCIKWENDLIDFIGKELHDDYLEQRKKSGEKTVTSVPWEELTDDMKRSNLDAAEDVPTKLAMTNHAIRKIPAGKSANIPAIPHKELVELAIREHIRWCREKKMQGWKFGKPRNDANKIHHLLVDWDKLPHEERIKDYQGISAIQPILAKRGYEIYSMG